MQRYVAGRLFASAISLFGLSILVFFFLHVVPGDAALIALGPESASSPQQVDEYRRSVGLDDPAPVQYGRWIGSILRGDLGTSLVTARTVTSELQARATTTLELALIALSFSFFAGVTMGTVSAVKHGTLTDQIARVASVAGLAIPNFWLGTLIIVYGAIWFDWFPPIGHVDVWEDPWRNLKQMVVPGLVLGAALYLIDAAHAIDGPRSNSRRLCAHGPRQGPAKLGRPDSTHVTAFTRADRHAFCDPGGGRARGLSSDRERLQSARYRAATGG